MTFPTAAEIPEVRPVDVASLPADVRAYRSERAKNWPTAANAARRLEADALTAEAKAAEDASRAERRARLAEILARQRALGHFEASEEIEGGKGGRGGGGSITGGGRGGARGRGGRGGRGRGEKDAASERRGGVDGGAPPPPPRGRPRPCRFWAAGACRRGDACGFSHVGEAGAGGGGRGRREAGRGPAGSRGGFPILMPV